MILQKKAIQLIKKQIKTFKDRQNNITPNHLMISDKQNHVGLNQEQISHQNFYVQDAIINNFVLIGNMTKNKKNSNKNNYIIIVLLTTMISNIEEQERDLINNIKRQDNII